jgi:hypothetical protein
MRRFRVARKITIDENLAVPRGFVREGFASLINHPRARRRPRARTARPRLAHSRAPGIGKDQSTRPVS